MGPIPSSSESLDIALSLMHILRAHGDVLLRPSTHQNWPRDGKLTQSTGTGKALLITQVFSNLMFNFKFYSML